MGEISSDAFCRWAIERLAIRVQATEAFLFSIGDDVGVESRFKLVTQIRPGDSTEQERVKARELFLQLAEPHISRCHDAVIQMRFGGVDERRPKFCLVVLICDFHPVKRPVAVLGFITQCVDADEARRKLEMLLH